MFLNHLHAIGDVNTTVAQAMLQNVSREELLEEFVVKSEITGVDLIPASIEDAFIASAWDELCHEHLPQQKVYDILQQNIVNKLEQDYDFIFIDSGPHLDAFLLNGLVAADVLYNPFLLLK